MSEIINRMIDYPSNGQTTPAFLARPMQDKAPGLVVIQEWWGLVPHIMDVCERFAHHGYVALAPDLYHGQAASEPDEARKLAMELDRDRAVQEIVAALQFLRGLEQVSPKKVGVVGWCMGGGLAVVTAAASQEVDAVVSFYGMPRDLNLAASIRAPLLGLYAEHDHSIPLGLVHAFRKELEAHNVAHDVRIYLGAQHAFFNDTRPNIYDPESARDAWTRTLDWFRTYLT